MGITWIDPFETDLTRRATELVRVKFEDKRYGDQEYLYHLFAVLQLVIPRTPHQDDEIRAAAILHDIIEDTDVTREDLERDFGPRVARIVWGVTDGEGKTRRERHQAVYQKLQADDDALLVKLCDRYANVSHCWKTQSPLLFMYHREYPEFRKELRKADPLPMHRHLWDGLDKLMGWRDR